MTTALQPSPEPDTAALPEVPYSRVRLTAGILGRAWLWFLAGCLVDHSRPGAHRLAALSHRERFDGSAHQHR